jgi:hypothetical protein
LNKEDGHEVTLIACGKYARAIRRRAEARRKLAWDHDFAHQHRQRVRWNLLRDSPQMNSRLFHKVGRSAGQLGLQLVNFEPRLN